MVTAEVLRGKGDVGGPVLSKTLAEKAGWEIAKEHGLDLVTINPSFVVGPVISSRLEATSVITVKVWPS